MLLELEFPFKICISGEGLVEVCVCAGLSAHTHCACVRACVCACACVRVRACMRVCVCVRACVCGVPVIQLCCWPFSDLAGKCTIVSVVN